MYVYALLLTNIKKKGAEGVAQDEKAKKWANILNIYNLLLLQ